MDSRDVLRAGARVGVNETLIVIVAAQLYKERFQHGDRSYVEKSKSSSRMARVVVRRIYGAESKIDRES